MRTIDQLVDLEYSEMTNEEIELVIEWRASVKAREDVYKRQIEDNRAYQQAALQVLKATADDAKMQLDDLVYQALERLRTDGNGQAQ